MNKAIPFLYFSLLFMISCQPGRDAGNPVIPSLGEWRGIIHMQDQELPFNLSIERNEETGLTIILRNGKEKIPIYNSRIIGDSIYIPMHIFDADLVASFNEHEMKGYWRKNYAKDYRIPFTARYGETFRFTDNPSEAEVNISGRWEVYFENESGKSLAVGEFSQNGNHVSGTILRLSGDYRYLVGEMDGSRLYLSTFDGEHAYLFIAGIKNDRISGNFYSGKSRRETWIATRNDTISLPDPNSLSFLREGYQSISFELPDMDGKMVSLDDPEFKGQVVIVQIFGTWCSNCMDETRFLSRWYNLNKERGVKIIALAFEKLDDFDYAKSRIEKLKTRFNIQYDFLFGGKSDRTGTAKALPMLNGAVSFPTLIFIDRTGKVRTIHTGFSGPGTGEYHVKLVEDFNLLMDKLLDE